MPVRSWNRQYAARHASHPTRLIVLELLTPRQAHRSWTDRRGSSDTQHVASCLESMLQERLLRRVADETHCSRPASCAYSKRCPGRLRQRVMQQRNRPRHARYTGLLETGHKLPDLPESRRYQRGISKITANTPVRAGERERLTDRTTGASHDAVLNCSTVPLLTCSISCGPKGHSKSGRLDSNQRPRGPKVSSSVCGKPVTRCHFRPSRNGRSQRNPLNTRESNGKSVVLGVAMDRVAASQGDLQLGSSWALREHDNRP